MVLPATTLMILCVCIALVPHPTTNAYIITNEKALQYRPLDAVRRALVKRFVSTERPAEQVFTVSETGGRTNNSYTSHIASIRSCNLVGAITDGDECDITINLGDRPNLVAVTGETGSGKSLLIAKAADLLTGGKATSSSLPIVTDDADNRRTFVEMVLRLSEPHLAVVKRSVQRVGLDPAILFRHDRGSRPPGDSMGMLILRRELFAESDRIRSLCFINEQPVTLDALRTVSSPLLAIVDAAVAAAALARQVTRMSILDTAVPDSILSYARLTRAEYRRSRGYREKLETELSNRILPVSMSENHEDKDIELLQHWINELDAFEQRMQKFCESIGGQSMPGSNLAMAAEALSCASWFDDIPTDDSNEDEAFSSALYRYTVNFREALRTLEKQLEAARRARDTLSSLSSPESVITGLERTRNLLFDTTANEDSNCRLSSAAEQSHDLLNKVEQALKACTQSLDDDNTGVLSILESTRRSINVSMEDIDVILGDWNTLARKHGIAPFALPACHKALKSELDGNVEARQLLPGAIKRENEALEKFEAACSMLARARQNVATQLSRSVSRRLPSLGMGGSTFLAHLREGTRNCTDASAYGSNSLLGVDSIEFLLLHGPGSDEAFESTSRRSNKNGGRVDLVASSGEKARILLAIECELPGSIGAASRAKAWNDAGISATFEQSESFLSPVTVVYDEIDAHVGGRAAVAMANMLVDQSRRTESSFAKGQIVSITHSPSVAAIADMHILIQRRSVRDETGGKVSMKASAIYGVERRKELARMASGDLAREEAEAFADALLRDGAKQRK